jgi:hypothetical protein
VKWVIELKIDGTDAGYFPAASFDISDIEASGSH